MKAQICGNCLEGEEYIINGVKVCKKRHWMGVRCSTYTQESKEVRRVKDSNCVKDLTNMLLHTLYSFGALIKYSVRYTNLYLEANSYEGVFT